MSSETLEQKVARVLREEIAIVPYDPAWPEMFRREKEHLRACLPRDLVGRIEHFGSTAVPGLAAKPIVDMLVEVRSLEETKGRIVPVLEAQGYDYFWRPTIGDEPPFYAWFLENVVQPNAGLFATLVALGELAAGLGLLVGLLTGIAAFGGVFMNANFVLAGVLGSNPLLIILGVLVALAWRNAGWIGLDRWFMPWIHRNVFAKPSSTPEVGTA